MCSLVSRKDQVTVCVRVRTCVGVSLVRLSLVCATTQCCRLACQVDGRTDAGGRFEGFFRSGDPMEEAVCKEPGWTDEGRDRDDWCWRWM